LKKVTKKIKSAVEKFNEQSFITEKIDEKEALSVSSPLYDDCQDVEVRLLNFVNCKIDVCIKILQIQGLPTMWRKLLQAYHLHKRSQEELDACEDEMCILASWHMMSMPGSSKKSSPTQKVDQREPTWGRGLSSSEGFSV
jgi:hypothetical protein